VNEIVLLKKINSDIRIVKNDNDPNGVNKLSKIIFIIVSPDESIQPQGLYSEGQLQNFVLPGNFYKLILKLISKEEAVNVTSAYSDKTDIFELFFDNKTYDLIDCAANDATISKMKKILGVPVS
jgi:hypothetical protein